MAATRRRVPFTAQKESDSDSEPEYLDEQQQEQLIESLQTTDEAANDFYKRLFTCLPLASAFYFVINLLFAQSQRQAFDALASLASVLSSAYTLYCIPYSPAQAADQKGKRPVYRASPHDNGPVERYLVSLNVGLAGVLGISACLAWSRGRIDLAVRNILPMAMLALVELVRRQLVGLDLSPLKSLQYDYKGA